MNGQSEKIDIVFRELNRLAKEKIPIPRPVGLITKQTGFTDPTVRKYLRQLAKQGKITIEESGDGRGIQILSCVVVSSATISTSDNPSSAPPPIATEASASNRTNGIHAPEVVILVDYDNLTIGARERGYRVDWSRIKEFARRHGIVRFCYTFLPPVNTKNEIIRHLWHNGFVVIACPMGGKDKDAVDAKLSEIARSHLDSGADIIVVVSDDSDFRVLLQYAADRGKQALFLSPRGNRNQIEDVALRSEIPPQAAHRSNGNRVRSSGYIPKAPNGEMTFRFDQAIKRITNGVALSVDDGGSFDAFIIEIINTLRERETNPQYRPLSFFPLQKFVFDRLARKWRNVFNESDTGAALSACKDAQIINPVIIRITNGSDAGKEIRVYYLNHSHPLVARLHPQ